MARAVILSAVRTPVGRYGGALSDIRPDDLAALVIAEAVARAGVDANEIEDGYFGAANQAGEDNRNVARMAALLAGLPEAVAGVTVNRLCASGLAAVVGACHAGIAGDGDRFVAGGEGAMRRARGGGRRRRSLRRRRRRVDEPRAVRDAEGREAVRAQSPPALRHDARLA